MRLLIDPLSDGHQDLILKIDGLGNNVRIADSYFVLDFLEIDNNGTSSENYNQEQLIKFRARKLIEYWIEQIDSLSKDGMKFIPFDLSDEYVGGFVITKFKDGYEIVRVYSQEIQGWSITKSAIGKMIEEGKVTFVEEGKNARIINRTALLKGLEWSKAQLL